MPNSMQFVTFKRAALLFSPCIDLPYGASLLLGLSQFCEQGSLNETLGDGRFKILQEF